MPGCMLWNEQLIDSMFNEEVALLIMSITLPSQPQDDRLVWREEGIGMFNVRSRYRLLLPTTNVEPKRRKLFRQLWEVNSPKKFRIIVWKMCMSFIPFKSILHYKRTENDASCPRCQFYVKDVNHAFRFCSFANEAWVALGYIGLGQVTHMGFQEWLSWLFDTYQ